MPRLNGKTFQVPKHHYLDKNRKKSCALGHSSVFFCETSLDLELGPGETSYFPTAGNTAI